MKRRVGRTGRKEGRKNEKGRLNTKKEGSKIETRKKCRQNKGNKNKQEGMKNGRNNRIKKVIER